VYRVIFAQPIAHELLMTLTFSSLNWKNESDMDALFLLTREGQGKSLLEEYSEQRVALSRYSVSAVVLSEPVVAVIRRELKRMSPDVRIEIDELTNVLSNEVIKRELLDGDKAAEARRRLSKAADKPLRRLEKEPCEPSISTPIIVEIEAPMSVGTPKSP
jgi:hypothetical protein